MAFADATVTTPGGKSEAMVRIDNYWHKQSIVFIIEFSAYRYNAKRDELSPVGQSATDKYIRFYLLENLGVPPG